MKGTIELIIGGMFSGKTTELFRRVKRYNMAGENAVIFRFSGDTRYTRENLASSHDLEQMAAIPVTLLWDAAGYAEKADVIAIDEGQFIPDLLTFAEHMANAGKRVIIAALDGDYQRQPFANSAIPALLCKAESVTKLNAICFCCKRDAAFTRRIDTTIVEQQDIGGADKYVASCRSCFEVPLTREIMDHYSANRRRLELLQSK